MKRYILSPISSAIIIPGLGQLLNNQLKKGLIILAIVFLLFVGGVVKLMFIANSLLTDPAIKRLDSEIIIQKFDSFLWVLITAYAVIWFYSILDAFIEGRKINKERDKGLL
ncbi:hypothetical protein ACFL0H_03930 [Thermodesulfobacteriota bacterium]